MPADLAALTDQLLAAARRAGADAADALAVDGTSISIDVRRAGSNTPNAPKAWTSACAS
jgi:hypothetical protein